MTEEKDFMYDDDEAVAFIRNYLPQELKDKLSDDDIIYVVDLIYEYYESKGYLSGDEDGTVDIDEDDMLEFVVKNAARDEVGHLSADEVTFVVKGELAYCDSIHMFE